MKDTKFFDKINCKLDFLLSSKYIPRLDYVVTDMLDKISWGIKWKKFTEEEADPLLDKVEQLQYRLR